MKADEKIEEQTRIIDMLVKQKEKDGKFMGWTKKQYERKITDLTKELDTLKSQLVDKDKEIKMQALKLRELIHDEFRKDTVNKNFSELARLASSP